MLKNKKAQTEVISDVAAFILILILSIALIAITQLSVISKLIQGPTDLVSEKGTFSIMNDRLTFYLNSKLQEKRGVNSFSDLIRANDETAKKELTEGVQKICKEHNEDCSLVIDEQISGCSYALKPETEKTINLCVILPGDRLTFVKVYNSNIEGGLP
ncbi:MAG: hypothetical protein NTX24_04505 [Candidatus Pacearchaeota archaeon]|nr:hypothetical protein [Candidatus Pacearchaeota archaeon]